MSNATQWAQVQLAPGYFELQQIPRLEADVLQPGEVLLDFVSGAVCGSDLPQFRGRFGHKSGAFGRPGFPFHEIVGTVVAIRGNEFAVGDRVVGWGFGGLKERFVTQASVLIKVPEHYDDVQATVPQALAVTLALADRVPSFEGKRVAIIGLGAYGALLAKIAKVRGAAHVTGIDTVDRSDIAQKWGVDEFVWSHSTHWANNIADDARPDIVIEAAGHQVASYADAINAVKVGGGVYLFGAPDDDWISIPVNQIWLKQIVVTGGPVGHGRHIEYLNAGVDFIEKYPEVFDLITYSVPYTKVQEAFEDVAVPKRGLLKIVITV